MVSRDHLTDLDIDRHVLDVFDVVRMIRHVYWGEALPLADRLDLDDDGTVSERDIHTAIAVLLHDRSTPIDAADEVRAIEHGENMVTVSLNDGSALSVPRQWSGLVTDLPLKTVGVGSMAALVVSRSRPFDQLRVAYAGPGPSVDPCLSVADAGVNRVPYRRLPHELRRFTALALDNIRHDPLGYVKASAHRAMRVFIIEGSGDMRGRHLRSRPRLVAGVPGACPRGAGRGEREAPADRHAADADCLRADDDLLHVDQRALFDDDTAVHVRLCRDRAGHRVGSVDRGAPASRRSSSAIPRGSTTIANGRKCRSSRRTITG